MPELPEEYLEYVRKNTSTLERLGDSLTTLDERINYVVMQLEKVLAGGIPSDVRENIEKLRETADALIISLREQMVITGETTQVRFQQTLAPLTGIRLTDECPFDGVITSVGFDFPPGCNGLCDVAAGHSGRRTYPRDGFIALNATTPVFPTNDVVNEKELLWAEIRNGDIANPHTITIILTIQRRL